MELVGQWEWHVDCEFALEIDKEKQMPHIHKGRRDMMKMLGTQQERHPDLVDTKLVEQGQSGSRQAMAVIDFGEGLRVLIHLVSWARNLVVLFELVLELMVYQSNLQ